MERDKLPMDADSRLKGIVREVTHPTMNLERTYCFICGKPWGWTTTESSKMSAPAHIVVSCDDCDAQIIGKVGGGKFPLQQVPTWLFDAYGIVPEHKETV